MLCRVVDGRVQGRHLACDAGDVDDGFGRGAWVVVGLMGGVGGGEEVGDGELGRADRVGEVDVEAGVAVGGATVFGRRLARWVPEVRKGLIDVKGGKISYQSSSSFQKKKLEIR